LTIHFTLNGQAVECECAPQRRALDVLREEFTLTGTKEACGRGECGSCTVLMNGARVNSCLIPALQLEGCHITTIEGVRDLPWFERIAQAFIQHGSVQCGFCIPGYVMSTLGMLGETPEPLGLTELRRALSGNMCRCTGYDKILRAVEELAEDTQVRDQITQWVNHERC
jgi:carbon-monoxide dehydrogenase small subunit